MTRSLARRCRRFLRFCWRSFRTGIVGAALLLVFVFVYLHNVGLPDFLKTRLVRSLHERGWDMEYSRLRFRWMQGVVGEGLHFSPAAGRSGPQLFVDRVDFRLNRDALGRFELVPESFTLTQGRCLWVLKAEGERAQVLSLENVQGLLKYREPDVFDLAGLRALLHGVQIGIEAHLTNASHLLELRWPRRQVRSEQGVSTEQFLHAVASQWDRCKVSPGTSIVLKLGGDVTRTNSFYAEAAVKLPAIESPWLVGTNALFQAGVVPPGRLGDPFLLQWRLEAGQSLTPWGSAERIDAHGRLQQRLGEALASSGQFELEAQEISTPWIAGTSLRLQGSFAPTDVDGVSQAQFHGEGKQLKTPDVRLKKGGVDAHLLVSSKDWNPLSGDVQVAVHEGEGFRGAVSHLHLGAVFTNRAEHQIWQPTELRGLDRLIKELKPLQMGSSLSVTGLTLPKLEVSDGSLALSWRAPALSVDALRLRMNRGELQAQVRADTETRRATATVTNTTDAHLLAPLLGTNAQRWLSQYGWETPPWVRADAEVLLPDWDTVRSLIVATNTAGSEVKRGAPWVDALLASLRLQGQVRAGSGDFRGATFNSASLSFQGSNDVWVVPDIVAHRPEGVLELYHESNESTRDYVFRLRSSIDPNAIRPILPPSAGEGFELFSFAEPPLIEGEIRGRWKSPELLSASGRVEWNRFRFRGEEIRRLEVGAFGYTNRLFRASDLTLERPEGKATLGQVFFSLEDQKLRLTNVTSHLDVAPVCRAIGPNVMEVMKDYQFALPPHVRLQGVIDTLKARKENEIQFWVDGQAFSWKLFNIAKIKALVDWRRDTLDLKDVSTDFYDGRMTGEAHFDFRPDPGTEFNFGLHAESVDLSLLMRDIGSKTNRIEGRLNCDLNITNANTIDKFTWNGMGRGEMTNGLLWDIPFFAVISPALNTLIPGIANSRARQATGSFVISNGVIYTQDLDIRANAMRMKSSGSVNFDKQLNARMEAELLRDTPAIGYLISKMFWPVTKLFEFKITGTLDKPKTDQRYIVPRLLMLPLHPIRTFKDLFHGEEKPEREKESTPGVKP